MDTVDIRAKQLSTERLDVVVALAGAALAVLLNLSQGAVASAGLDLLAYTAAACIVRWPVAGGTVLAGTLLFIAFAPSDWLTVAEYASLIPVLGAGVRGEGNKRLWMTVIFGLVIGVIVVGELEGSPAWRIIVALVLWAGLFAFMWAIGNLFTAFREAQDKARVAALREQQVELARELHDTVARELSRASLHAQALQHSTPMADLEPVLAGIQRASGQLRWMMSLLRDPGIGVPELPVADLGDLVDECARALDGQGFTVTSSLDGDPARLDPAFLPVLRAAVGEACANIERHADPARQCVVMFSIDDEGVDGVFINGIKESAGHRDHLGMGLDGLRERLSLVGGDLVYGPEGTQWITRFSILA